MCLIFPPGTGNTNYTGPCAPGYYCPPGQQSDTPSEYNCTLGNYCPQGTGDPIPCDPGYYQDEIRQSECKDCPAGRFVFLYYIGLLGYFSPLK